MKQPLNLAARVVSALRGVLGVGKAGSRYPNTGRTTQNLMGGRDDTNIREIHKHIAQDTWR